MKPRKFVGASSREVLKQVRDALGPDALIVSNAKVAGGIEVIALPSAAITDIVAGASNGASTPEPRNLPSPAGVVRREPSIANAASLAAPRTSNSASVVEAVASAAPTALPAGPKEALSDTLVQSMLGELRNMRCVLEQRLAGLAWTELSRRDPAKVGALRTLLGAGFSAELARRLSEPMPDAMEDQDASRWLVSEINRNIVTAGAENDIIEHGGVYAIVGPTGVGKTTTTAKLAARGVVRHGAERVALLTTDTYRIGAHEQLRIYGRILGVTTCAVRDAAELKTTLSELRGKHMVLIDTIGMSQRDKLVAEQVTTLARSGGNVKRLLLLNATCNGDTLEDVVRCYDPASLDGCILTKLDEAQSIGAALDVLIRHRLALHFVANGQRVPEDLHVPNRQYLIHRALRAVSGDSAFALADDEYPLALASANATPVLESASGSTRRGAYLD
jgi:flagellar biosynthesis protein FlhF